MSIRIAGEMVKQAEGNMRRRYRRALAREELYLRKLVTNRTAGGVMQGDIEGAFHRLRSALSTGAAK